MQAKMCKKGLGFSQETKLIFRKWVHTCFACCSQNKLKRRCYLMDNENNFIKAKQRNGIEQTMPFQGKHCYCFIEDTLWGVFLFSFFAVGMFVR